MHQTQSMMLHLTAYMTVSSCVGTAPQAEHVRDRAQHEYEKAKERGQETYKDVRDSGRQTYEDAKSKAHNAAESGVVQNRPALNHL